VAVGAMTACLVLPVDTWAVRPLEDRFPAITIPPVKVDGIVVLGVRSTTDQPRSQHADTQLGGEPDDDFCSAGAALSSVWRDQGQIGCEKTDYRK
jgi:hypothetical protein